MTRKEAEQRRIPPKPKLTGIDRTIHSIQLFQLPNLPCDTDTLYQMIARFKRTFEK